MSLVPERWARLSDLREGQTARCRQRISAADIQAIAEFSGDFNPVHVDRAAARRLGHSRPVAHGLISMALLSRLIGMELPGPGSIWFHQDLDFLAPVREGDEVEAKLIVQHISPATGVVILRAEVTRLPSTPALSGRLKVRVPALISDRNNPPVLSDLVAIVTGASRGLGQTIAEALAGEGIAVVVNYRNDRESAVATVDRIRAVGNRALAIQADITCPDQVQRMFDQAIAEFGRVDILVNSATPPIIPRSFAETHEGHFRAFFDTYVIGTATLAQCALPAMKERRYGRIVNILSSYIVEVPTRMSAYITGKSALYGLSRAMAVECAPFGITVNMISPSMLIGETADDLGVAVRESVARKNPMRRLCEPEMVAAAVKFLIANGSSFISGANIPVTGGILF